jgi:hypothetical protein
MSELAEVTRFGFLDMQVCVPEDWPDNNVITFAEKEYPCGTSYGWHIRREGDEALLGQPERNPCAKREGFVHIMLDA